MCVHNYVVTYIYKNLISLIWLKFVLFDGLRSEVNKYSKENGLKIGTKCYI